MKARASGPILLTTSLIFAALSQAPRVHAQAQPPEDNAALGGFRPWSFFGGYTSHEFANPGVHLGAEYALATTRHFQTVTTVSFQAYSQPDIESGYAIHTRWGHRYRASFGLTFDSYLGIGAQYTRYETTFFVFRDGVATAKEDSTICLAVSPHILFGPGYDFQLLLRIPLQFYAHPGVMVLYPDLNQAFQVSVFAELGLRWTPKL
ncbi:MAG TPA: hypothetical protein VJN18_03255 [Polyangiaceae bacterium]|nr:hypothetical protein [Polyangiaceae bacterium]